MECLGCGAQLASKDKPCLFCGQPYRYRSPIKISPLHLRGYIALALVTVVLFSYRSCVLLTYDQRDYLQRAEVRTALRALAEGKAGEARKLALELDKSDWYSGFPSAIVAAAYYQDYLRGDKSALQPMDDYSEQANRRDPSFFTRYLRALVAFHKKDYEQALLDVRSAKELLHGNGMWRHNVDGKSWNRALGGLEVAILQGQAGKPTMQPILFPPANVPHPDRFDLSFKF